MRISDWSSDVCSSDLGEVVGLGGLLGHRHEQLEAGHRIEVRVRLGEGDREGHGLVVGIAASERVGLTSELLGATLDEVEEVAVVTGELGIGSRLPACGEPARKDLFAVVERDALAVLYGPNPDLVVHLVGHGTVGPDPGGAFLVEAGGTGQATGA